VRGGNCPPLAPPAGYDPALYYHYEIIFGMKLPIITTNYTKAA